ncbi:MAG: TM2 domain-containing protein [Christensenellaceae bacterium]
MSPKSRTVDALLCFFLGILGVHRFYEGKIGTGILWLCTGGLAGVGVLVDFILILCGKGRDKDGLTISSWS